MRRYPALLVAVLMSAACGSAGAPATTAKTSTPGVYEGYSTAEYDGYVRTSQYLTMRDGTRLAADILRPSKAGVVHTDKLPVVWTHHRYNRAFFRGDTLVDYAAGFGRGIDRLLYHGYVIAAIDTRGGGASFGNQQGFFMPAEAEDAYEITEWLAAQPWSTGNVGMTGRSYLGITQLFAASKAPPHLKAIFPEMYVFEWYPMIYPGGVYRDDFFTNWQFLTHNLDNAKTFTWGPSMRFSGVAPVDGPQGMAQRDSAIAEHAVNRNMFEMWGGVPYRNSVDKVSGKQIHLERGPATYLDQINKAGIPIYGLVGWYDAFPRDAFLWFKNLKVTQKLVVGPWFHGQTDGFDLGAERHRWFDHWLKGVDNGIEREPALRYFVIDAPAATAWRSASTWPLPEAVATDFYFREGKAGSAGSFNDGRLIKVAPQDAEAADTRVIDTTATLGPGNRWANTYGGAVGYPDLAANDAKGFTWTTAPLDSPVEVIGHPIVRLWITSSANDVDAMVYLEDVDSTGKSTYVTEGVLRASHRKLGQPPFDNFGLPWPRSFEEDVAPLPNEPTELVFDLHPTAKRFGAGHRIRVTLQGADRHSHLAVYPKVPPRVSVYRDANRPSRIVLPIVPVQ
ncbi:MAG: CocE/NonD family hydrolase [Gemmatimonadales bacterium]|nr:CocE/NonD family hydrolase [Gemmatimonadales bacterium]